MSNTSIFAAFERIWQCFNVKLSEKSDTSHNHDSAYDAKGTADTAIAALVNSAPETLNTLNELATALGNDENFATTVATQIGAKVDKVDGMGLSSNDYDSETKTFVDTLKTKNLTTEEWTFTLSDGSTVTKKVMLEQ